MKMSFGNEIGFEGAPALQGELLFEDLCGSIVAELTEPVDGAEQVGATLSEPVIRVAGSELAISDLAQQWEGTLESVYPTDAKAEAEAIPLSLIHI